MITIYNKLPCFVPKVNSWKSLSSSSFTLPKFDVFLSFSGKDTRKNFISFLYKELEGKGILTFKDDNELESGRSISSQLLDSIKESRIAVVVISENYPASSWCLDELVTILELQERDLLTVIPIFYEVDPKDIRRQSGKVEKQFKIHKKRHSREKVELWKTSLTSLANLSGYCSKTSKGDCKLIDEITERISNMFSATESNGTNPIEIEEHMNKLNPLLGLNSNEVVQVKGIWVRGINGRTTFAKHVYDNISHNFEAHCFLEDMKRVPQRFCKFHLQKEFLSKIEGEGLTTKSFYKCLKARLRNKKILLVANNVANVEQLETITEEFNWFGQGSIIIITAQDKQWFISSGVEIVYEVELLRSSEVDQLFRSEAFKQLTDPVTKVFRSLAFKQIGDPVGQLFRPLAFKQIGDPVSQLFRSLAFKHIDDPVGLDRPTYRPMNPYGTVFWILKYVVALLGGRFQFMESLGFI